MEIKKTIPFTIASKKKTNPRNKPYQGCKAPVHYKENYKTPKKEIVEDTSKGKHILRSWIGRINIIKMMLI